MEMSIKKVLKHYLLGESLKEIEINRILTKVSKKSTLNDREARFLELYNHINDDKDLMYLSKNSTCERIKFFLDNGKKIICDLHDRNGLIGLPIIDINNNYDDEYGLIIMKSETYQLKDSFLYNLVYDKKLNRYSLQEQDEYFEKLEVRNDD
jgi:hypothetical protein